MVFWNFRSPPATKRVVSEGFVGFTVEGRISFSDFRGKSKVNPSQAMMHGRATRSRPFHHVLSRYARVVGTIQAREEGNSLEEEGRRKLSPTRGVQPQPWFAVHRVLAVVVLVYLAFLTCTSFGEGVGLRWKLLIALIGVLCMFVVGARASALYSRAARRELDLLAESEQWRARAEAAFQLQEQRHDFFNELTVLSAFLQMNATDRALAYIHRVLAAHKGSSNESEGPAQGGGESGVAHAGEADFSPVFGLLLTAKQRALQQQTRFHVRFHLDDPRRKGVDLDFIHVLARLLDNALDAVAEAEPWEREVDLALIWTPGEARVELWNSGPPIAEEHVERIFEPGFSTKGVEHWGLGLDNVRRWVKDKGGVIRVESRPGHGALFRLILPTEPSENGSTPDSDDGESRRGPRRRTREKPAPTGERLYRRKEEDEDDQRR